MRNLQPRLKSGSVLLMCTGGDTARCLAAVIMKHKIWQVHNAHPHAWRMNKWNISLVASLLQRPCRTAAWVKGRVLNFFFSLLCDLVFGTVQKESNEKRFSLNSAERVCVCVHSSRLRANQYSKSSMCMLHQKAENVARGETLTDFMRLMSARRRAPCSQIPTFSTPRTLSPG